MSLFIIIILVVQKMKKREEFTYNNIKHDQSECQLDGYLNNDYFYYFGRFIQLLSNIIIYDKLTTMSTMRMFFCHHSLKIFLLFFSLRSKKEVR